MELTKENWGKIKLKTIDTETEDRKGKGDPPVELGGSE